jgi:coatomer subunit beta'
VVLAVVERALRGCFIFDEASAWFVNGLLASQEALKKPSERVKSVDLHPSEPWVLTGMYTGHVIIHNVETGSVVKSFEVTPGEPVRCARFVPRQQWIVAGSDDFRLRAINYNTGDKVAEVDAHADYIRFVEPHPTMGVVLTASDDMTLKLWDWSSGFTLKHSYEGHAHFLMMARFHPKDPNTFASASLDRSIKVWAVSGQGSILEHNFSLEGHERGVNCLDYYHGGDRPYLISGADDNTMRIWDYQTRSCVTVLEQHTDNVSAVLFHPRLPLIISGSEDGSVKLWHSSTYEVVSPLEYGMDRCWTLATSSTSNHLAMGFDGGAVVVTLGDDVPIASMDRSGKLIKADNNQVGISSVRSALAEAVTAATAAAAAAASASLASAGAASAAGASDEEDTSLGADDGAKLALSFRDMGSIDMYPRTLRHNSNGRFVAALGDNEYVIYTAQALRSKSFGKGRDLAWSSAGSGDFAVLESPTKINVFKNFTETASFRPAFSVDKLSGGSLLAVQRGDCVQFWAWEPLTFVMQVDAQAKGIYWSESGDFVAVATPDSTYILALNRDALVAAQMATGEDADRLAREGVDGALEVEHELSDKIISAEWAGDCLIFVTSRNKLCYFVGGRTITVAHLPGPQHLLGFLPKEGRVIVQDRAGDVFSYRLSAHLLEYQTCVVRRDFEKANTILPSIPRSQHTRIAKFLESQGFKEEALAVSTDPEHRFELAVGLNRLDLAYEITTEAATETQADEVEVEARWKQLADLALVSGRIPLAVECAEAGKDLTTLLLLYTALGHAEGLRRLADAAERDGRANVALSARLALGDASGTVDVLRRTGRLPDAAIFARSHCPSRASQVTKEWVGMLRARAARGDRGAERAAEAIADPGEYPALFPGWEEALAAEEQLARAGSLPCAASMHSQAAAALAIGAHTHEGLAALQALSGSSPAVTAGAQSPVASSPVASSPEPASPAAATATAATTAAAATATAAASSPKPASPPPQPSSVASPSTQPAQEPETAPAEPEPEPAPAPAESAPAEPAEAASDDIDDMDFGDLDLDAVDTGAAAAVDGDADEFDLGDLDLDA